MATDSKTPIHTQAALEFKSTSLSVPILVIFNPEIAQLEHQIEQKIAQARAFFKNSPVIIDLQTCNYLEQAVDLPALIDCLYSQQLFPIGICGGNEQQNAIARERNIPASPAKGVYSASNTPKQKIKTSKHKTTVDYAPQSSSPLTGNLLITQPVRSGQSIYAKGDLTVLSHVSAGAEIMAEGNIHVYGALRGRALAGVPKNEKGRIFCSALQAELVSIAGYYQTNEHINKAMDKCPAQIYLQDQTLIIKNL